MRSNVYYGFKTSKTADIHYFLEFYLEHIFGFIFLGQGLDPLYPPFQSFWC